MDVDKMEELKKPRNKLVDCILSSALTAFFCFAVRNIALNNSREECANRAAMTHYQPVGNGGALASMYGRINPERESMLEKMQQVYEEISRR